MNFQELKASLNDAKKVETAKAGLNMLAIMKLVGVESYNRCDGEYHLILEKLLPFFEENGFEVNRGGQTHKYFTKNNISVSVGYNLTNEIEMTGVLVKAPEYDVFFPMYNEDYMLGDEKIMAITNVIKTLW